MFSIISRHIIQYTIIVTIISCHYKKIVNYRKIYTDGCYSIGFLDLSTDSRTNLSTDIVK